MDKRPSEQWKDYLHESKGLDKAARLSFDMYVKKYAKHTADDLPSEKFNTKILIPGKIYTFMYTTMEKPTKDRPFIDRRPIFLSFGNVITAEKKLMETGIDLMLVPPKVRIFMLDNLYKHYKKQIEDNEKTVNEGNVGKKPLKLNHKIANLIFHKLGWQQAYCAYDRNKMAKIAIIDYSDWVSLIPLQTKGIQGKPAKDIYNEYIKKMTNPSDKNLEIK